MRRPILLVLGCIVAGVIGVAGATAITAADESKSLSPVPVPGTDAIGPAVSDPAGGPGWAVRVYQGEDGGLCLQAGRSDNKAFGHVDASGRLVDDPIDPAGTGSCWDIARDPVAVGRMGSPDRTGQPARTVLFGAVEPGAKDVTVTGPGGKTSRPELGPRGTYVVVFEGLLVEPKSFQVDVTLADGSVEHRDL